MDQMQARPQTVSRARARESANGNAVGLPHLQPAAVGQTAKNWFPGSCDLLKRDRTIRSAHNQKRNKSETLHPTKTLQIDGFFTASIFAKGAVFEFSLHSIHTTALTVYLQFTIDNRPDLWYGCACYLEQISLTPPAIPALTLAFSYSCKLFCALKKSNPFIIKQIQTLSTKHPGCGYPLVTAVAPKRKNASL